MTNQSRAIIPYRPSGQPAKGSITVNKKPSATPTVTVDGVAYTYGTDFVGNSPIDIAESLAALINGATNRLPVTPGNTSGIRSTFALQFGTTVQIVATEPGTVGNAITLATSDSASFTVSAGTLSGGSYGPDITVTYPATNPRLQAVLDTPQRIHTTVGEMVGRGFVLGGFKSFDATTKKPTINSNDVYFGYGGNYLPYVVGAGDVVNVTPPLPGTLDLYNFWMVGSANDGLYIAVFP